MAVLADDREIYPNAPLKLVAFELRFPEVPELINSQPSFDQLLRRALPVLGPPPASQVRFEVTPDQPARAVQNQGGLRRIDRRRRRAVAITPFNATVETSDYSRYEDFRSFVEEVLGYMVEAIEVPAVERIGLRYVDEIDPAQLPQPVRWSDYIAPDLLGVADFFDTQPVETTTLAAFAPSPRQQLVLRYGVVRAPVANPNGPLHISGPPVGPHFVIDIDSSHTTPSDDLPEFSPNSVLDVLDMLHQPVRDTFERMITPKLRQHLRAPKGEDN